MANAASSSSDIIASSGCNVCQGLGDVRNPRWFLTERKPDDNSHLSGRYIYTYIHHANIGALAIAADSGCGTCSIIGDALMGITSGGFSKDTAGILLDFVVDDETARLQLDSIAQPNSKTQAEQSEHEALEARKLAQLAKREGLYTRQDLTIHGYGMIVIQSYYDEETGPWARNRISDLQAFVLLNTSQLHCDLLHFNTTCTSRPAGHDLHP